MKKKLVTLCLSVICAVYCVGAFASCNNEEACEHHFNVDNICEDCGYKLNYTEGLQYRLGDEGRCYYVRGIGIATDADIVIPAYYMGKSVMGIGDRAFEDCSNLTSVEIPNGVTSIGYFSFAYCNSLKIIVIPNSVTYIDEYAFYACGHLTSVTIGNGVTEIGRGAFDECWRLTSATFKNVNIWIYENGSISPEELADPVKAAEYLKSGSPMELR